MFDNTLVLVKTRSSLTSDDAKSAPVLFRLDPHGKFAQRGVELRALRLANTGDRDHDADVPFLTGFKPLSADLWSLDFSAVRSPI